jgi:Zn ribbon nucleic-acid-binding protein
MKTALRTDRFVAGALCTVADAHQHTIVVTFGNVGPTDGGASDYG